MLRVGAISLPPMHQTCSLPGEKCSRSPAGKAVDHCLMILA